VRPVAAQTDAGTAGFHGTILAMGWMPLSSKDRAATPTIDLFSILSRRRRKKFLRGINNADAGYSV
jgi:hypothetical protein